MKRRDRGDRRVLKAIVCRLPSGPRPSRRGDSANAGDVSVLTAPATLTPRARELPLLGPWPGATRPPRSLRSRR